MDTIWSMQLHPNRAKDFPPETLLNILNTYGVIGIGDDNLDAERFKHTANVGDYVVIRDGSNIVALVKITGQCETNDKEDDVCWFSLVRHVEVLSTDPKMYYDKFRARYKQDPWNGMKTRGSTFQRIWQWEFAKYWIEEVMKGESMRILAKIVENKFNVIFTGAPGTGKTYLARQIAAQMILRKAVADEDVLSDADKKKLKEQMEFVQFHPSMDYTDFVEGLRPVSSGDDRSIGFELRDGVFKAFCKKAIAKVDANFDEAYSNFAKFLAEKHSQENPLTLKTTTGGAAFRVFLNSLGSLSLMTGSSSDVQGSLTPEKIKTFLTEKPYAHWEGYYKGVIECLKEKFKLITKDREKDETRPYVFVIDEINRGDIAKIFGELFFAIDPGYRGIKGRIKTQYDNLIEDDDAFKDGFYVPDNVYIIGTMNDIDRGVESMDFAIRRRFTWKDVKPEETQEAILRSKIKGDELFAKVKNRMDNLNAAISAKDSGLGSAYCIGGAYFTHVKVSEDGSTADFDSLWNFHLEPLLREYMRGQEQEVVDKQMEEFKKKFNDENPPAVHS